VARDNESKELLAAHVPADLAERFRAWARERDGSTAAALRRLISETVDGAAPAAPRGVGRGVQVGVRLKGEERAALADAARARGTTPANWLRSLAIVHLCGKPQWNDAEVAALRELFRELRRIGTNVNQIAHQANAAALSGLHSPGAAREAREAADKIQEEMRRLVAVMTGNFDHWGLPKAARGSSPAARSPRKGRRRGAARLAD
jgi:hypothetical protein